MGHTEEAAKFARQCMFAMLDYFGMNSLFLSTTPDDECSFRVRLYLKAQNWVSSSKIEYNHLIPHWNYMLIFILISDLMHYIPNWNYMVIFV